MTFYADPSFFMLLALAVAGAAFLGLREKPIARYGMVASVAFLACLFCKDLPGLAVAALFVATATLSTRWVLARPRSNGRFAVAFALILVPLLSAKAGAVFDQNLLGFMGVSYITFKALQVLFEVRDGVIEELGLFDYLYFLLFFPVFTSGPIDRSRRFAEDARKVRSRDEYAGLLARGILLLLVGLVYTFVIAVWLHRFYAPTAWGTGPFLPELGQDVRETRKGHLRVYRDERMPAFKAAEKPCDHTCGFVAEHHRRLPLLRAGRQGGGNAIGGLP